MPELSDKDLDFSGFHNYNGWIEQLASIQASILALYPGKQEGIPARTFEKKFLQGIDKYLDMGKIKLININLI